MYRWSLLKTGCCVWFEFASIFLSLLFEKQMQIANANGREACQDDQVQVRLFISLLKELLVFLSKKCLDYLQSCILNFLTANYDKRFHHQLEPSSSVRLGFSFFMSFVLN